MTIISKVTDVPIIMQKRSLKLHDAIGMRSTAEFVVYDAPGTANYVKGQKVTVYDNTNLVFGGFVDTPDPITRIPHSTVLLHTLKCVDWHYLADKRLAAESYLSQTAGYIVQDLVTKYLTDEGITVGSIQAGSTILETVINYAQVSKAFDALAEKSGYIWYIDKNKALWFIPPTTTSAPFAVSALDIIKGSCHLSKKNPQYRNRQYIRAGRDTTSSQVETRTGDGIIKAWPMSFPLNQVPTCKINTVVKTVGIKGIDTGKDFYWNKGDAVISAAVAPSVGAALEFTYFGEYDILALSEDAVAQAAQLAIEGGTGIVEWVDDEPNLNTRDGAWAAANSKLTKFAVMGRQFTFAVWKYGLAPGQVVYVTYPAYGLNATPLLIESMDITIFARNQCIYTVNAIEGAAQQDWTAYFSAWLDAKEDLVNQIMVGKQQVLVISKTQSDNWKWAESITQAPFACQIPSVTNYPSASKYPC